MKTFYLTSLQAKVLNAKPGKWELVDATVTGKYIQIILTKPKKEPKK